MISAGGLAPHDSAGRPLCRDADPAEWAFREPGGRARPDGFAYTSDTNDLWLSAQDIRQMLVDLSL